MNDSEGGGGWGVGGFEVFTPWKVFGGERGDVAKKKVEEEEAMKNKWWRMVEKREKRKEELGKTR